MEFVVERRGRAKARLSLEPRLVLNAGYAGRNQEAVRRHIEELEQLGVPRPGRVPMVFAVSNHLLLNLSVLQVIDTQSSAEIEYVLLFHRGSVYVTVGSDHSDREVETRSIQKAKNSYPNVVAGTVWPLDEVTGHFDQLELTCEATRGDAIVPYQHGKAADLLPPSYWLDWVRRAGLFESDVVFYSGTIAAQDGLHHGDAYRLRLHDPVLGREIVHSYRCPVVSVPEVAEKA
ncbi:DUF2848 family protein [Limnochorda pilosa]|uniref:DUF2848 domain-containing protein n=1 Tax=Limnochorda pilosa TaxID=1555112 RepID=A0A0K2SLE2_LIMPI|nr:DUF2848 family protein [Limnochorda pilosa]BAS27938.1 hypothetical protein LIP_2097 [Limnochorda pilosa]